MEKLPVKEEAKDDKSGLYASTTWKSTKELPR